MSKFFLPAILILHLALLSQLNFTAWPEMLTYPYLLTSGFSLYQDFIFPYPPGLVWLLAAIFNIFGYSPQVLKILTWTLILAGNLVAFMILKKIIKQQTVALFFLGIFIFLQSFLDGNMLWFDNATVLPLLLSFYFAWEWINELSLRLKNRSFEFLSYDNKQETKSLFLTGLFLAVAVMIKQTAILYLLTFFIFMLTLRKINLSLLTWFVLGPILMGISLIIYVLITGSWSHFLNWTLIYPLTEWSKFPGYVDFVIPTRSWMLTLLLLIPLGAVFLQAKQRLKDPVIKLTSLFFLASLLAVYPRFSFFHLQPAIALAIILFAQIFINLPEKLKIKYLVFIVVISLSITLLLSRTALGQGIRFYSLQDQKLGEKIASEVKEGEKVFLLGLNASQYVFTHRLPPKRWTDNFGWYLQIPGVQQWVIEGLKEDPPAKVIWRVPASGQWYNLGVYQPQEIVQYLRTNYQKTGKIEEGIEIWSPKN